MKWLILFISIIVLFLIQDGVLNNFSYSIFYFNPALVFVFVLSLFETKKEALFAGVAVGLIMDFLSGLPDGAFTLSILLAVFLLNFTVSQFLTRELSLPILHACVAFGIVLVYLLVWAIMRADFGITPAKFMLDVLATTLLTYPVYMYYNWVNRLITRKV